MTELRQAELRILEWAAELEECRRPNCSISHLLGKLSGLMDAYRLAKLQADASAVAERAEGRG